MRVLVTGQHGFTGRYLLDALRARGHDTPAFDADLTDPASVRAAVKAAAPERVVHLAALAFVHSDDFSGFYTVNQLGTFHLLQALADEAPGTPVLLASTANIYGPSASGFLTEETSPDPVNHYGLSKWAMEVGARMWADRLPITIVRPFNYTGVGQEERYLVPKIVAHFRRREPIIELGNLNVRRDFGDVRSVVEAYCALAERGTRDTYNVCAGMVHSIHDILEICRKITGHAIEVRVNPAFVRANDVELLGGDSARLRAVLPNWRPLALRDTLTWMLSQA